MDTLMKSLENEDAGSLESVCELKCGWILYLQPDFRGEIPENISLSTANTWKMPAEAWQVTSSTGTPERKSQLRNCTQNFLKARIEIPEIVSHDSRACRVCSETQTPCQEFVALQICGFPFYLSYLRAVRISQQKSHQKIC